jgi:hypothetical protein
MGTYLECVLDPIKLLSQAAIAQVESEELTLQQLARQA